MFRKGFTLVELIIVIAITIVLGVAVVADFTNSGRVSDLRATTQEIASLLRQAQSDSISGKQGKVWGVYFDNTNPGAPFYALYASANGAYTPTSEVGHYALPSDLCYISSTVPIASSVIIYFNQVSGLPSASTSVSLQLGGCGTVTSAGGTSTISQSGSGEIFFDSFNRSNL